MTQREKTMMIGIAALVVAALILLLHPNSQVGAGCKAIIDLAF